MGGNVKMLGNFSDYPDTNKMCVSVFFSGCDFGCESCHNMALQDPTYRDSSFVYYDNIDDLVNYVLEYSSKFRTNHISIMGGDPLYKTNVDITRELSNSLLDSNFKIMIYTGYGVNQVKNMNINFTYLKTGLYNKNKSQDSLLDDEKFVLGSTNQVIWDNEYNKLSKNGVYKWNK
jgi:organic radical activating enzyme